MAYLWVVEFACIVCLSMLWSDFKFANYLYLLGLALERKYKSCA